MRISLFCIGKTNTPEFQKLIADYLKRIPRYFHVDWIELPDVKNAARLSPADLKQQEGELLLTKLEGADLVFLLDEKGKEFSSREFADEIRHQMDISTRHLAFVIGGAFGFSPAVYEKFPRKISLSRMTFTHQMIRVLFAEQLYRASTIIEGKSYHND